MTLIVEDGTIVAGANTYRDLTDIRAYATARGVTLGVDAAVELLVTGAMDWIKNKEPKLNGSRVGSAQTLPYPRSGLVINGFVLEDTDMPELILDVECQLIIEQHNGVDIFTSIFDELLEKRDKTDVLETEFDTESYTANRGASPVPLVETMIKPLLRRGGALTSVRI